MALIWRKLNMQWYKKIWINQFKDKEVSGQVYEILKWINGGPNQLKIMGVFQN